MSRPDAQGFSIMDVSTTVLDDEKFQRLGFYSPDHYAPAVVGFVATLARSWRKGRRVTVQDAWPVYRPFDQLAVDALIHVHLLDKTGRIPAKAWREWFEEARSRRDETRARWRKDKQNERERQRGVRTDSVPDQHYRPSVPAEPSVTRGRAGSQERPAARGGPMESAKATLARYGYPPAEKVPA